MEVSLTAWVITIAAIALLFVLDLGAALLRPRKVHFPEALSASIFYIAVALLFGIAVSLLWGWEWGTEYFAGYILEKSLSVDNLFVFLVIISAFAVPEQYQQRVLITGIFLALIFRIIFISLGAALLSLFSIMFFFFGLLLLWTAIQLFRHRDEDPDINDNFVVKAVKKRLPFSNNYGTGHFMTKENGQRVFTPILLVLIAIATTDLLFALDSIPAIFGVTQEIYIVFAANAFALLGLRALFFLVTGLLERLVYLSTGLSLILGLIGIKLILHWLHTLSASIPEIPTAYSLVMIIIILATTTIASVIESRRNPARKAHPGTVRSHEEEKD